MSEVENVTEEQATEALYELVKGSPNPGEELPKETETEPAAKEAAPAEEPEKPKETAAPEAGHVDDLESLKARNAELEEKTTAFEAAEKRFQERLEAHQQRSADNERILHDKFLRKATATERALKTLMATRTEEGVDQAEVDRVISELQGTMNPASASYAAPEPTPQPQMVQPQVGYEDQTLVLNNFLNEKNMTGAEQEEFGAWIRTEAQNVMPLAEQSVARESPGGFLRLAHIRWQSSLREKEAQRNDAVGAVKSVQRTQREAARAAAATTTAPQKQPTAESAGVDTLELTPDDVASLMRQAVEQYR